MGAFVVLYAAAFTVRTRDFAEDAEETVSRYPTWLQQIAFMLGRPTTPGMIIYMRVLGVIMFAFGAAILYLAIFLMQ